MSGDDWPFFGRQAVRRGEISASRLQRDYRPIYRNVYLSKQATLTALTRARAAWLWSGGNATLTGLSAAAVLGTKWLNAGEPAELCRPNRHAPPGIVVRSYDLNNRETRVRTGIRITTPERTAFDIGRSLSANRSIPVLDAVANATNLKVADVVALADTKPGIRGVRRLRSVLKLVDGGAESPQESRVRLLLVGAGLPAPETQIEFTDELGIARIRVDMGWREWRVAVEYDGVQHWYDRYQRSWDIDRIAMLEAMGWVVIRVSAEMLSRPSVIIERVRRSYAQRGVRSSAQCAGYALEYADFTCTSCQSAKGSVLGRNRLAAADEFAGPGVGGHTVLSDHLAGDDRRHVAVGGLIEATPPGGEIVGDHRLVQS